ncbi:MAG: IS1634 family transposase [Deltaproteobacteria bacterium]|nr:IS1634 family transposase [Deltaproteobacteria bacterium]
MGAVSGGLGGRLDPGPTGLTMFFRYKQSPTGQCLQLLEAYRNAQGQPRQRVVVSLGNLRVPPEEQTRVACLVEQRLRGQTHLPGLRDPASVLSLVDTIAKRVDREGRWLSAPQPPGPGPKPAAGWVLDGVLADRISHTHTTPLGPTLVAWQAWQRLGLPAVLESLGFTPAQGQAAAASVINRLVDPGSELALVDWWPDSSLPELLEMEMGPAAKDRFYRISDQLFEHRQGLEEHLRRKQSELFTTDRTLLLYDLTNTYFEGEALGNPKAQRGHSKEKRNDCPQIVLGMVFDRRGFELAHRIFEGKQSDAKSLVQMIEEMDQLVPEMGQTRPEAMVLLDGGIATKPNLALLRQHHYHYLVNDSRRGRKAYRAEFLQEDQFTPIGQREDRSEVRVRKLTDPLWVVPKPKEAPQAGASTTATGPAPTAPTAAGPEAPDTLVLCWSQGREEKEKAICSQAEEKYLEALEKLGRRIQEGRLQDGAKIDQALGRLQQKHPRVRRFYQVAWVAKATGKTLQWTRLEEKKEVADDLLGCYVLRTDRGQASAEEIWQVYMTLSRAEDGFRALKGDLGLRPNYHQIERRVEGHVWITILAYHLLCWIQETLKDAGDARSWGTIRRVLQTHCYTTIVVPTKGGKTYRLRKAGEPEEMQKAIYEKLKINWASLPQTKLEVAEGSIL